MLRLSAPVIALLSLAAPLVRAQPVVTSWMLNPAATTATAELRKVLPNVHRVRVDGEFVTVESAGLALQSLAALAGVNWEAAAGPRHYEFRLPLHPRREEGEAARTPVGAVGVMVNGVPLFSPVSPVSWRDQNLWHLDAVASLLKTEQGSTALLDSLLQNSQRHSPLIGFALDGFPIYGPYGFDEAGKIRRFSSSYQLRRQKKRAMLPDGTALGPSQEGPPVGSAYPAGTFVEDYEYVAGSGDLDEHNGRWARTPEYPEGTWAYFLSTTDKGAMQYPYLLGDRFYGQAPAGAAEPSRLSHSGLAQLSVTVKTRAGEPARLRFTIRNDKGQPVRFLEKVHEQPIHLVIVSPDLREFAHIHPALQPDNSFLATYTFPHAGTWWLYADHTPPGKAQTIARFQLEVLGDEAPASGLIKAGATPGSFGLDVRFVPPPEVQVGKDLTLQFDIRDPATGQPLTDLEPYLGAWAHLLILSDDGKEFIHAHPVDETETLNDPSPWQHSHALPGPSPATVRAVTGFRQPGHYRLWLQVQRQGEVFTYPWDLKVLPGRTESRVQTRVPADAIRIQVSASGFHPDRLELVAGKAAHLAFKRDDPQGCANTVVFPELGIRKALPPGETVLIEIPAGGPRELQFACGMKMYRGSVVVR